MPIHADADMNKLIMHVSMANDLCVLCVHAEADLNVSIT